MSRNGKINTHMFTSCRSGSQSKLLTSKVLQTSERAERAYEQSERAEQASEQSEHSERVNERAEQASGCAIEKIITNNKINNK